MGIVELKKKVSTFPAFGYVPLFVIKGKRYTPIEVIDMYMKGENTSEIESEMQRLKIDPDYKAVTIEYLKRVKKITPNLKIVIMGKTLTIDQAIKEIERDTSIGKEIVNSHAKVISEMLK